MKKYIYLTSGSDHLFDVSKILFEKKIAKPVLWLGHHSHEDRAINYFGNIVLDDLTIRHRIYELKDISYSGENQDFFDSINYLRAKDRCFKMMDRLDFNGTFNRLDREVFFHYLSIILLKNIEFSKPDILISPEAPHDWPKYLTYEICRYLKIPSFKFFNWNLAPICFIENLESGKLIKNEGLIDDKLEILFDKIYKDYVEEILIKKEKYEIFYMKRQREKRRFFYVVSSLFYTFLIPTLKDLKHNIRMKFYKKYNPINSFRFGIISRLKIRSVRRRNLKKALLKTFDSFDLKNDFVYFPLHFEPERTTNPDGGDFHDQFIVLTKLRKIIPPKVKIVVKEHPSQIIFANEETLPGDVGSRGRSPLFYNLIKNIDGVRFIDYKYNSVELIIKSKFVATITGSVALESSILGKPSLSFGSTWYAGCPNIIQWNNKIDYDYIINLKIESKEKILEFLKYKRKKYSFPNAINSSQKKLYQNIVNSEFDEIQKTTVVKSLEKLFQII